MITVTKNGKPVRGGKKHLMDYCRQLAREGKLVLKFFDGLHCIGWFGVPGKLSDPKVHATYRGISICGVKITKAEFQWCSDLNMSTYRYVECGRCKKKLGVS